MNSENEIKKVCFNVDNNLVKKLKIEAIEYDYNLSEMIIKCINDYFSIKDNNQK